MLAEVVVYTAIMCSYCDRAKDLLKDKGVSFQEISIMNSQQVRETMIKKSGGRKTVPQIFINGKHIGGYSELKELEDSGSLMALLQAEKKEMVTPKIEPALKAPQVIKPPIKEVKSTSQDAPATTVVSANTDEKKETV